MPKLLNQDQDEIFLPQKARDQDFQASLALLWQVGNMHAVEVTKFKPCFYNCSLAQLTV